jgi:hypothetical protein
VPVAVPRITNEYSSPTVDDRERRLSGGELGCLSVHVMVTSNMAGTYKGMIRPHSRTGGLI